MASVEFKPEELAVEFKGVRKGFGDHAQVLKGVDLSIPKGKITAIIGFSGAGKSVMMKHVLGLLRPDTGEVTVLGQQISKLNDVELNELRKKFGMLFQSAALFDDMTTMGNVSFPIIEFKKNLSPTQVQKIAAEKLKVVGLGPEHFEKFPSELSGGMRKRVGLARAIALEPEIILYDEPTTGLDPVMTEVVDELIVETHHHRKDLTTIVISHDLHAAFSIADYVAMLDDGKIRLFGEPADFLDTKDDFVQKFVSKALHRDLQKKGSRKS